MYRKRTPRERFWEVLPGLQFWGTISSAFVLSIYKPMWAALFIICFDLYWVLKAVNVALHLWSSYKKFQILVRYDWMDSVKALRDVSKFIYTLEQRLATVQSRVEKRYLTEEILRLKIRHRQGMTNKDFSSYYHLVVLPYVHESFEVLDNTLEALSLTSYPKEKLIVVLASEERAGEKAVEVAAQVRTKYQSIFENFYITVHPDGLEGEIKGKSANASWAVSQMLPVLESLKITVDQVLVANLDSDTVVHPQYFARVTYEFLTAEKPYRSSYQPIAIYNNNIWDSPAFIRVVSVSNSFWQFTESSRPDRLRTFSSHSMTLKALLDVGLWKKDLINEDGYIYWQCYLKYNGDYRVVPLFIPISLDTCLAETTWQTLKNQYKQKKRWAYNVEYYPTLIPSLLMSKAPLWDRLYKLFQYVEGNFNWATASILISSMVWLPLFFGGDGFLESIVAFNLPATTKMLMTVATFFLIFSVYINLVLLPPRPSKYGWTRSVMMYLQWLMVPIVSVVFGSIPAIEAQTRLMMGWYMEFWVTPKARKGQNTALQMQEMQTVTVTTET